MLGGCNARPNEGRWVADAQALSRIKSRGVCDICEDDIVGDLRITGLNRIIGITILRGI